MMRRRLRRPRQWALKQQAFAWRRRAKAAWDDLDTIGRDLRVMAKEVDREGDARSADALDDAAILVTQAQGKIRYATE